MADSCFCGSDHPYTDCCGPLHRGEQKAATAEQLMRYCQRQRWLHLEILKHRQGGQREQRGEVEFVAWYLPADATTQTLPLQLHELSRFARIEGNWCYIDGDQLPDLPRKQPERSRNAPCWCGSGTKFKQCHGR